MPAFRSSADRIAISDDRQLLHDDCDRETPPLIVDTARGGLVDGVAAELTVAEDRSWPIADIGDRAAVGPQQTYTTSKADLRVGSLELL